MEKLYLVLSHKILRYVFLIGLLLLCVYQLKKYKPYPTGDALEYSLVTEALFQHQSPDILPSDILTFKESTEKNRPWNEVGKNEWYSVFKDSIQTFKNGSNTLLKTDFHGITGNENRKVYSIHFISYSILALPFRIVFEIINVEPLKAFIALNMFIMLLVVAYILFFLKAENQLKIPLSLLFIISPLSWYISWVHADYFIAALACLSILLYADKRYYLSILVMAIAATQNQTFVLITAAMGFKLWMDSKYSFKTFVRLLIPAVICVLHPIYNKILFNEWSLITFFKYTDSANISIKRFSSFFFDLNQGMIIAFPFWMLLGTYFLIKSKKQLKDIFSTELIFVLIILISIIPSLSFNAWNLGQAVVSRYAIWFGAILIGYVLSKSALFKNGIMILLVLQLSLSLLVFKKKGFFIPEWDNEEIKPHVTWIWNKFPNLYNPEPKIFYERTQKKWLDVVNPSGFPAYYTNSSNGIITKVLVHKNHPESLLYPGSDSSNVQTILAELNFDHRGFAYYHPKN